MADKKITDMTELAAGSQATGDLVAVVDVSESAAADKNKKMTMENLFKGIPGDVGIGTSAPDEKLHISATANSSIRLGMAGQDFAYRIRANVTGSVNGGLLIEDAESGNDLYRVVSGASGSHRFFINNSEKVRIDSAGRTLIGHSAAQSPVGFPHLVQIEGTASTTSSLSITRSDTTIGGTLTLAKASGGINQNDAVANGNTLGQVLFNGSNGTNRNNFSARIQAIAAEAFTTSTCAANLSFETCATGATTPTERLRITSSGNVGIGTASPVTELHVEDSGSCYLTIEGGTSSNTGILFGDSADRDIGQILYDNSTNSLEFIANTSERMRIDSSGNVGIGTSSPASQTWRSGKVLDVFGGSGSFTGEVHIGAARGDGVQEVGSINFYDSGQDSTHHHIALIEADKKGSTANKRGGALHFYTKPDNVAAPAERMIIDSSGNVGIGTTSPNCELHVGNSSGNPSIEISRGAVGAEHGYRLFGADGEGNVALKFLPVDNGSVGDETMRIDGSGRLLVGLSSGANRNLLQIQGDVDNGVNGVGGISLRRGVALGSIGDGSQLGQLDFCMSDGGVAARIICDAEGSAGTGDYPGRLQFETTADSASSPTERMRIGSNGFIKASNYGGYYSTAENVHEFTTNNSNTLIARFYNNGLSGQQYGIEITTNNDQNDSTRHFFQCVGGSTIRAVINSNGGFKNYQSNDVNLCDEREKKNIVNLDSTWDCLKNWELKKFHYNEDSDTDDKRYGVIAQQVAEYCPEVIADWTKQEAKDAVLDEDGNVVTPAVEEVVRMGVKEQQMMWMAIKALQEAQTRIETLEAKVAALEAG